MSNGSSSQRMQRLRRTFREECAAANLPCWLCGQEINYAARPDDHHDTTRFQLDHFFPVSTHMEYAEDPANFRASHALCNQQRGNKMPEGGLGSLSEEWY